MFWKRKKESVIQQAENIPSYVGYAFEAPGGSKTNTGGKRNSGTSLKYEIDYTKNAKFAIKGRGTVQLYRIIARQHIIEWGVEAGDVGGWVESHDCLSQYDNSWIANEAKVLIGVYVKGNVLIKDSAVVMRKSGDGNEICYVRGNAQISGNAFVVSCRDISDNARISGDALVQKSVVKENATVTGTAQVFGALISGSATVKETASVHDSTVTGTSLVKGYALVRQNSTVKGASLLAGRAVVGPGEIVNGQVVQERRFSEKKSVPKSRKHEPIDEEVEKWNTAVDTVINKIIKGNGYEQEPDVIKVLGGNNKPAVKAVKNDELLVPAVKTIENEYKSYSHDIVKLIKYPLMTDSAFEPVGKFQQKLRKVKRHMASSSSAPLTEEMVDDLETAYLAMEAACVKESTRKLDDADRKKLKTASSLVDMALDEASSEHEKTSAAKKALDYLDGIVLVPEEAVETFRVRAGLKELTAG